MEIELKQGSQIPVYRQIAEAVAGQIAEGQLAPGDKLPTVRQLAEETGLAQGTVKHAYDELEKEGLIEMVQGRGTFVRGREESASGGRKDLAMAAIDALLDRMEELGFSSRESEIFFSLKLREREEGYEQVRLALVDCNTEALSQMADQLSRVADVDVYQFLLDDVLGAPYKIGDHEDLVITTSTHFHQLSQAVGGRCRLVRVVLSPSNQTLTALARAPEEGRVGILTASDKFGRIIRRSCTALGIDGGRVDARLFGEEGVRTFVEGHPVLILPPNYNRFCSKEEGEWVRAAARAGQTVIRYDYLVDGGSLLAIEEQIEEVRRGKKGR